MSLIQRVTALAQAVAADIKALDSGKVNSDDPRLTDAREWSAATVPQEEAEAGTASTRRAWTAQRVRQAINAWWQLVTSGFGRNFIAATNEQAARNMLQLGTAATRYVGESIGNVMQVGAFGLGNRANDTVAVTNVTSSGIYSFRDNSTGLPPQVDPNGAVGLIFNWGSVHQWGLFGKIQNNRVFMRRYLGAQNNDNVVEFYHTGNTTKNPDGTLKASSPVINLYTNRHDIHNEEQFGATPVVTRKSKGVYEITGTLGLRSECWYLDTPNDRNGNKYFNVEWTQNITPDAVDGIVDEYRDDIVVTIETFERVWNKETGIFENGAPIDINDLQSRFVQLRFNEIKIEHKELDDETITRNQE